MPSVPLIRISQGRIQGTDEIAEGLTTHTLQTPLLGAVEDPGVLEVIPEQCSFAFIPLGFSASTRRTEGTTEDPFTTPTSNRNFLYVLEVLIEQQ